MEKKYELTDGTKVLNSCAIIGEYVMVYRKAVISGNSIVCDN